MRVVMAPDSFRGTLTAPEAARAMAEGWRRHAPDDEVVTVPLSDGGAGFVEAVRAALPGTLVPVTVDGPLPAQRVPAAVLVVAAEDDPSGGRSAYVDTSHALGRHLVADDGTGSGPDGGTDVLARSSRGAGQLLAAAVATGAGRVVLGLGRAAVLDGGAGALEALGVLREGTTTRERGGLRGAAAASAAALGGLRAARERLAGVDLVVATDVDAPLVGRHGPVQGVGRDVGLPAASVGGADAAMTSWAGALVDAAGPAGVPDPGRLVALPGSGAAGGLGVALLALGAVRSPGAGVVAAAVGLEGAVEGADLVLTGEGAFDWDSLRGRVVGAVADAAGRRGVPVVVVAGQVLVGRRELAAVGVESAYPVADGPQQLRASLADPAGALTARTERVARTWHR